MYTWFEISDAPTNRVLGVLKTTFKLMFMQMTEASAQFYEKFDSFRIMAIKKPFKLGLMNSKIFLKKCKDYFHSKD